MTGFEYARQFSSEEDKEAHKGLPAHSEETGDRLDEGPHLIKQAVLHISRAAEGECPEEQRNNRDGTQRTLENVERFEEGFLQNMSPVRPVIGRQLHDHAGAGLLWREESAENL